MRPRIILLASLLLIALVVPTAADADVATGCERTETGFTCVWGPFKSTDEQNDLRFVAPPGEAGFITSMRATLIDEDGDKVPHHAVHLHHVVLLNPSKPDMTCDFPADRFFASGAERTRIELPEGFGYYWDNQPPPGYPAYAPLWGLVSHLDYHHADGDVFMRVNLSFTPGAATDMTDVKPVWLDVDNCDDSEFDIARGRGKNPRHHQTWTYTMPEGGRFITMAGHLHDRGVKLRLDNETTGAHVFTSKAVYGDHHDPTRLTAMSVAPEGFDVPVAAGDVLELTATYRNDRPIEGAMGIMMGVLVP